MAVFDYVGNMYDIKLKPRLLKSLLKERLPDEKHPFPGPSDLAAIVTTVRTHALLSETIHEQADRKQTESWNSAVDAWVERVLSLASSKMPDKCWAGICLLGVTCQQCSSDRFLASYSVWFQKLLSQIQPPADLHFVKLASCASLSELFTRLGGFSNMKKDGTSHAGKVVQPILKLLSEDPSEAAWESAIDVLCKLIMLFPASVHRHYEDVEAVIVAKIISGKCSTSVCKKLAQCLALLPKSRGDEDSWSLMIQKILIYLCTHLNDALQGLEDETKGLELMRLLVLPGKDPPPPLGGQPIKKLPCAIHSMSTLIGCCSTMLSEAYPAHVPVPIRPLLALVERILAVDGALFQSLVPFATVTQQEFICSQLPILHACSLELLFSVIKGLPGQALPYAAVVCLLTKYFKQCVLPSLRIKVYSIMRVLLVSMRLGMSVCLAQDVITNAFADLQFVSPHGSASSTMYSSKAPSKTLQSPAQKKRKRDLGSLLESQSDAGFELVQRKHKHATPLSVQIAALQALEALLSVGGAMRLELWRSDLDRLLITVATSACHGGCSVNEKYLIQCEEQNSSQADFQLAAFRALLASLLSPARVRPPYLSQGLELFRRGMQAAGTKLSEFCCHALLTLEVLIHPRALPLSDFSANDQMAYDKGFNHSSPANIFSGGQKLAGRKPSTTFSRGALGDDQFDPDDDLCESWLGNGEQTEGQTSDLPSHGPMTNFINPSENAVNLTAEVPAGDKISDAQYTASGKDEKTMVDLEWTEIPVSGAESQALPREELPSSKVIQSSSRAFTATVPKDAETMVISVGDPGPDTGKSVFFSCSLRDVSGKGKGLKDRLDSDASSLDSLPDIVDADPDSSDADDDD